MKMDENDDLLPEYDDVAEDFPSSEAVNEALRFLSRITKEHKSELTQK